MKLILPTLLISAAHYLPSHQPKFNHTSIQDTLPADDEDKRIFVKVMYEATYKGGDSAWKRLVDSTLTANVKTLKKDRENSEGTCEIQFLVWHNGTISDVQALTQKNSALANILIKMVTDNPNWNPAKQGGQKVNAFHRVKVEWILP